MFVSAKAERTGGHNPTWNTTRRFTVPASGAGSFHVLLGDRIVGKAHIPISELLSDGPVPAKFVAYHVRKINSGKPQGVLNFSYKLGEVTQLADYTPKSASAAYVQPPPAAAYSLSFAYPPRAASSGLRLSTSCSLLPPVGKADAYPHPSASHRRPAGSQG